MLLFTSKVFLVQSLSETKVRQLGNHATLTAEHDVFKLDITMDDLVSVKVLKRVCYLKRYLARLLDGERFELPSSQELL